MQEPAAPQVFDNALPTLGLQAHCVISRFVDHIPYYRQEQINARAGVHTPRSPLAAWSGQTGAQLMPLYEAHRAFVLASRIVHADETPISLLDPGAGKTKKAYMWAYARSAFESAPGVVFDFCAGRGGKYPTEFLKDWSGTLVVDAYSGYDAALALDGRSTAYCLAHYLECSFIQGSTHEVTVPMRSRPGASPHINPVNSKGLRIQSDLVRVCRLYGHSVIQDTAIQAHAQCSGHPVRVAWRSLCLREQRAAIPAMDQ